MLEREEPSRPLQIVAADFYSYGPREYLAYVDRLSGWVSIVCFNKIGVSASELIPYIRKFFVEYGVPERFESDQGLFKANEFQVFLNQWGVEWNPSAPHYPQSNGLAESAVKKLKSLVAKIVDTEGRLDMEKFDKGLLELRNTPNENGASPAQLVFGQEMRSVLPSITFKLMKERRRNYYNLHSKNLNEFLVKDKVRIQNEDTKQWDRKGIVVKIGAYRQYLIELPNGRKLWRNRRFLRLAFGNEKRVEIEEEVLPCISRGGVEMERGSNPRKVTSDENTDGSNCEGNSRRRRKERVDYKKMAGLK